MRRSLKLLSILFLLCFLINGWTEPPVNSDFTQDANHHVTVQVDLFMASTCSHCHKADAFFRDLEKKFTWLKVNRHVINNDKSALELFRKRLETTNSGDYHVPGIFFCKTHWIGFDEPETTGKTLLRGLNYCHDQIVKTGKISPGTIQVLNQWANVNWVGASIEPKSAGSWFTPLMSFIDVFNPCSLFIIFLFVSFLWLNRKQPIIQIWVGLFFLTGLVFAHYAQQKNSVLFYEILAWMRLPAILVGLGLLFYLFSLYSKRNNSLYFIYALAFLTALIGQAYQQTCDHNFALVYEQWISGQPISSLRLFLHEIAFQLLYLLPLIVLMFVVMWVGKSHWFTRFDAVFKLAALIISGIIGLILVIYPFWLAKPLLSFIGIVIALLVGWLMRNSKYYLENFNQL